jgi:hypothetical protein
MTNIAPPAQTIILEFEDVVTNAHVQWKREKGNMQIQYA